MILSGMLNALQFGHVPDFILQQFEQQLALLRAASRGQIAP